MLRSSAIDGFRLAYERQGSGPAVVLLHGWPGDRHDWREVAGLIAGRADVVIPDLRGFGESDKHAADPRRAYSLADQTASVAGLIEELNLERPVLAGYDVGSRVGQQIARVAPRSVGGLVLAPPLPGAGDRVLAPQAQREFWYQPFHQLELSEQLIDGDPAAVRAYLEHFWTHWSGPGFCAGPRRARSAGSVVRRAGGLRRPRSAGTARARGWSPPAWPSARPSRRHGSPRRRPFSGPSTIRCSHGSGGTTSTSSSPM